MHKSALLLGTCLLGLSLSGCAFLQDNQESQSTSSPDDATASPAEPSADIRYADFEPEELYLLLSGEIAAQRGRFDVTLVNYMNAAQQSRDLGVI